MNNRKKISAIHDDELLQLIEKLGLKEKMEAQKLKCKFTETIITFDNLYSIFPESGDIKVVCDNPEAIKLFSEYVNDHSI